MTARDQANSGIERNSLLGLLFSLVLLGLVFWLLVTALFRIADNSEQILRSESVTDTLGLLLSSLQDVETGERGYVITGMSSYLVPHEHGLSAVYSIYERLLGQFDGDTDVAAKLQELKQGIDRKLAVSRRNVEARKQGFEAARDLVASGAGKQEMDTLRGLLDGLQAQQSEYRGALRETRNALIEGLKRQVFLVAILLLAGLFALHWRMLVLMGQRYETEQHVRHLATHDALTGLPNRRLLLEHLAMAVERGKRNQGKAALLFIDLDGFKPINDQYGHDAGDKVLKIVAHRLAGVIRGSDLVSRLGGDEFVILLEGYSQHGDVCRIIDKVSEEIERPIRLDSGDAVAVESSIGVAVYPEDGEEAEQLLQFADSEMYAAKRQEVRCHCHVSRSGQCAEHAVKEGE